MIKPRGFGLGPSGPTPEEIEKEAAAELRKALAGSGPRKEFPGINGPSQWTPVEPSRDSGGRERGDGLTPDDERRAITELAMQQLTDRPVSSIRPADTILGPGDGVSPEEMRNRALAQVLERQRRMAQERPVPTPPKNRVQPATGQRTAGVTISPQLTVKPTLTSSRPSPLPADIVGRGAGPVPAEILGAGAGRPSGVRPSPPGRPAQGPASGGSALERALGGPAAPVADPPAGPAVRARPGVRRPGRRSSSAESPDERWRALAELADLLAEEAFPGDSLPEVARWLADLVGSTVAIVLIAGDAIDGIALWPGDDPVALQMGALVGQPVDVGSTLWEAVASGDLQAGDGDEPLVMPDGSPADGVRAWLVAPIADHTVVFGAVLVVPDGGEPLSGDRQSLIEEVALRVGRALFNCEEVASSAGEADSGLPGPLRDHLGALSVVLDALAALPAPALAPELRADYQRLTRQAADLRAQLDRFQAGDGGGG